MPKCACTRIGTDIWSMSIDFQFGWRKPCVAWLLVASPMEVFACSVFIRNLKLVAQGVQMHRDMLIMGRSPRAESVHDFIWETYPVFRRGVLRMIRKPTRCQKNDKNGTSIRLRCPSVSRRRRFVTASMISYAIPPVIFDLIGRSSYIKACSGWDSVGACCMNVLLRSPCW